MRARIAAILIPLLLVAFASIAALSIAVAVGLQADPLPVFALGAVVFGGFAAGAWWILRARLVAPVDALVDDGRRLAHAPAGDGVQPVSAPVGGVTGDLATSLQTLRDMAERSAREVSVAVRTGAGREEQLRRRLETVIRQLSEGVLVCDARSTIRLANRAARRLLAPQASIELGSALTDLFAAGPIEHAISLLDRRDDVSAVAEVICPAASAPLLLRCRLSRMPVVRPDEPAGFVVAFTDVTGELAAERERDDLVRSIVDDLRPGLANLRAAAENLDRFDDLPDETRRAFQRIVVDESTRLSDRVSEWASDRRLVASGSAMVDIESSELVAQLAAVLADDGLTLTQTGAPLWIRADSHGMVVLLAQLARRLAVATGRREFDVEVLLADRGVCLDLAWEGEPVAASAIESWKDDPIDGALDTPSAHDILRRHRSELWSLPHRQPGFALLRIPLPLSPRQWQMPAEALPARPEFYDFELGQHGADALRDTPLAELAAVAFDTETTGLDPDGGDELIAIAGVRVDGGKVLSDETFDELIKPGRPIPSASVRYHGIADRQVRYKPPVDVVLPRFVDFVGHGRVLIGHNAAFDMHFLTAASAGLSIPLDHAVLDVLLLAVHLAPNEPRQSLGAIAARYGLAVSSRRNVLDDARLTASVFTALVPALEADGVRTLGAALDAMARAAATRQAQLDRSPDDAASHERSA